MPIRSTIVLACVALGVTVVGCANSVDQPIAVRSIAQVESPVHDVPLVVDAPEPEFDAVVIDELRAPADDVRLGVDVPAHTPDRLTRVWFEPTTIDPITSHRMGVYPFDGLGYGSGGTLLDIDGDRDLDVYLGQVGDGTASCLYENESTPGRFAFTRVDGWCRGRGPAVESGAGVDVDQDGFDELITLGVDHVELHRFIPEPVSIPLLTDDLPGCRASSVLAHDLDLDGRLDLLVVCVPLVTDTIRYDPNLVFLQQPDGSFEFSSDAGSEFIGEGNTLAFASFHADDDGLLDVAMINDTFSRPGRRNFNHPAGGVLVRCPPTQTCTSRMLRFADNLSQFGSFMGFGVVHLDDVNRDAVYLSDWGPNRLTRLIGGVFTDEADWRRANTRQPIDGFTFSWGVVVDDIDFDGRDDIFVSQGGLLPNEAETWTAQHDVWFVQRDGGRFVPVAREVGLLLPAPTDPSDPTTTTASRSTLRADLDGDGAMELFVLTHSGTPRVYSERSDFAEVGSRCTLVPESSVVPAHGAGYGIRTSEDDAFRQWFVQGQMQFTAPDMLLAPASEGQLRFPSGAVAPFDCADETVTTVTEPEWLDVVGDSPVVVRIDADVWPATEVSAAVERADGRVVTRPLIAGPDGWTMVRTDDDARMMLRIDGRWIGRWWGL